eukprot:Gb_06465 [translate_table: standard]
MQKTSVLVSRVFSSFLLSFLVRAVNQYLIDNFSISSDAM